MRRIARILFITVLLSSLLLPLVPVSALNVTITAIWSPSTPIQQGNYYVTFLNWSPSTPIEQGNYYVTSLNWSVSTPTEEGKYYTLLSTWAMNLPAPYDDNGTIVIVPYFAQMQDFVITSLVASTEGYNLVVTVNYDVLGEYTGGHPLLTIKISDEVVYSQKVTQFPGSVTVSKFIDTSGIYTIVAEINSDQSVAEANYDNNIATLQYSYVPSQSGSSETSAQQCDVCNVTFYFYNAWNLNPLDNVTALIGDTNYTLAFGESLNLAAGRYLITFSKDGYENTTLSIDVYTHLILSVYLQPTVVTLQILKGQSRVPPVSPPLFNLSQAFSEVGEGNTVFRIFTKWVGGDYLVNLMHANIKQTLIDFFNSPPLPGIGILAAMSIWGFGILAAWLYYKEPEPVFAYGNILYFGLAEFLYFDPGILFVPLGTFVLYISVRWIYKFIRIFGER